MEKKKKNNKRCRTDPLNPSDVPYLLYRGHCLQSGGREGGRGWDGPVLYAHRHAPSSLQTRALLAGCTRMQACAGYSYWQRYTLTLHLPASPLLVSDLLTSAVHHVEIEIFSLRRFRTRVPSQRNSTHVERKPHPLANNGALAGFVWELRHVPLVYVIPSLARSASEVQ